MVHVMQQRQIQPQYQFEAFFAMSSMKKDYDQALATLHEFTKRVIRWSHLLFLIRILWNMIKRVQQVTVSRQSPRLLRMELQLKFLKNSTAICSSDTMKNMKEKLSSLAFGTHDNSWGRWLWQEFWSDNQMILSIREKRAEVVEVDSAIPIEKDSAPAPKGQIF